MNSIAQHLRGVFLIAIAIALMSCLSTTAEAQRVRVRVRGNGGAAVAVNANSNANVNVRVNGGFRNNANVVRVNGFRSNGVHSNVFVVPQPTAFFVTPQYVVPTNNFGVSAFGFQTFGVGGCCH